MEYAIGMIETYGDVVAIEALDTAFKSSNVISPIITYVGGGIVTISFFGDVASVRVAVDAGVVVAEKVGIVLASHVIARLSEEVFNTFKDDFRVTKNIDSSNDADSKIDGIDDNGIEKEENTSDNNISDDSSVKEENISDNNISDDSSVKEENKPDNNISDDSSVKKVVRKRKKKKQ